MKMYKQYTILICISSFFLLLSSCSTLKKEKVQRGDYKIKNINDLQLHKQIEAKYLDFETLYMKKVAVEYSQDNKEQSFRCNLRIKKDSIIWLSASKMGIEGFRIKLTQDSIFIIDRLHKQYFKGNYQYLNNKFNTDFDFFIIQSILTNQIPEYGKKKDKPFHKNFQGIQNKNGKYIFFSNGARGYWKGKQRKNKRNSRTIEIIEIAPDIMRIDQINICEFLKPLSPNKKSDCRYNRLSLKNKDFSIFNEKHLFPSKIEITGGCSNIFRKDFSLEDSIKFHINIDIKSLLVDKKNLSFPFSISSKYKQIDD